MNVLTSTFWPAMSGQDASVTWPAQMQAGVKIFESYYYSRHSGRKLSWQPNLGTVDVRVQFKTRKHELNVSTFAMIVLCLFEDRSMTEPLSFADIKASTKIADGELKRTLQSLACTKQKILLKEPKGKDISEGDRFVFNENFTSPLARIKIAQIAARVETQAERKETNEKVLEERQHLTDVRTLRCGRVRSVLLIFSSQLQASIVRIMKDRKECTHNELVNEAIRQISVRFQPSPADIKKRIEVLMDRVSPHRPRSYDRADHDRSPGIPRALRDQQGTHQILCVIERQTAALQFEGIILQVIGVRLPSVFYFCVLPNVMCLSEGRADGLYRGYHTVFGGFESLHRASLVEHVVNRLCDPLIKRFPIAFKEIVLGLHLRRRRSSLTRQQWLAESDSNRVLPRRIVFHQALTEVFISLAQRTTAADTHAGFDLELLDQTRLLVDDLLLLLPLLLLFLLFILRFLLLARNAILRLAHGAAEEDAQVVPRTWLVFDKKAAFVVTLPRIVSRTSVDVEHALIETLKPML